MEANEDDRVRPRRDSERTPRSDRSRRDDLDDDVDDRRVRRSRDEGDGTGGVIPYKNPKALTAYYLGVFGLISCFMFLGFLGIVPIILGILGLKHAKEHPEARGQVHAIIGILLGTLELLTFLGSAGFVVAMIMSQGK